MEKFREAQAQDIRSQDNILNRPFCPPSERIEGVITKLSEPDHGQDYKGDNVDDKGNQRV